MNKIERAARAIAHVMGDDTDDWRMWEMEAKAAVNAMQQWQPIETAPKDGTKILGWNQQLGQRETFMDKYTDGSPGYKKHKESGGPIDIGWYWFDPIHNWASTWKPTHWMPLPEPPK